MAICLAMLTAEYLVLIYGPPLKSAQPSSFGSAKITHLIHGALDHFSATCTFENCISWMKIPGDALGSGRENPT